MIRVPQRLDSNVVALDMLHTRKDQLDVFPVNHIVAINMIIVGLFDSGGFRLNENAVSHPSLALGDNWFMQKERRREKECVVERRVCLCGWNVRVNGVERNG